MASPSSDIENPKNANAEDFCSVDISLWSRIETVQESMRLWKRELEAGLGYPKAPLPFLRFP